MLGLGRTSKDKIQNPDTTMEQSDTCDFINTFTFCERCQKSRCREHRCTDTPDTLSGVESPYRSQGKGKNWECAEISHVSFCSHPHPVATKALSWDETNTLMRTADQAGLRGSGPLSRSLNLNVSAVQTGCRAQSYWDQANTGAERQYTARGHRMVSARCS